MSVIDVSNSLLQDAAAGRARVVGLTVQQYDSLIEQGLLPEDPTTELIDGLIVQKDRSKRGDNPMTVGDRHRVSILRCMELDPQFRKLGCFLQSQQPVAIPPKSEPEPDISVIRGCVDDYLERKPGPPDTTCVIEVADSSLRRDLGTKLRIYAQGKIPQYVVADLVNNQVIVHTMPSNGGYSKVLKLRGDEVVKIACGKSRHVEIRAKLLLP
jgi:hypothetical protein